MEEEIVAQEVAEQPETDWKAKYESMREHMRDWEKKAKANQSAADELEKLKAEQMTEQEKATARAEAAEAELAKLVAERERTEAAQRIASDSSVPLELLLYCSSEEAMNDFAKAYAREAHVSAAPSALGGKRIVRGEDKAPTNGELFAEFAEKHFRQ